MGGVRPRLPGVDHENLEVNIFEASGRLTWLSHGHQLMSCAQEY